VSQPYGSSRLPQIVRQVPQEPVASPAHLPTHPQENAADLPWYKPSFGESLMLLGWRWIYFLPAAGIVVLLIIFLPMRPLLIFQMLAWWKLLLIAIAVPLGIAMKAAKNTVAMRKEPFCIHCGYDLTGLPDGHNCPECGRPFNLAIVNEYRRDPDWFIQRYNQRHMVPTRDVPFAAGAVRSRRSRDGT
jgi:hypothetical protein